MINHDYFKQDNVINFQWNWHFSSWDMFLPKYQESAIFDFDSGIG